MQPTNSQQALKELQTYQGGRKSSRDVLTEAETRLGVPTQQQRLTGLRSALGNTENLIRSVEPGVAGRTGGSYVTEAQRNRLVGIERAPLDEAFREQSRGLEGATADLGEMNRQALTEAQLRITDDDRRENELQKLYDTLYGREQADKVFAENQRQFNEQQRAASAQNNWLKSEMEKAQAEEKAKADAESTYASVDKDRATTAIKSLLNTGNQGLINRTIAAISDSAKRGNMYDKFKLELIDMYRTNSSFGNLLRNVSPTSSPTKLPGLGMSTTSPGMTANQNLLAAMGIR